MNRSEQTHNIYKMLSIALICLFAGLGIGYFVAQTPFALLQPKGCTMEARLCPDGSAVGRSGPSCEFDPCPLTTVVPSILPMDTQDWKTHTIETDPAVDLTNYMVQAPLSWVRVEHSSNFQNTEVFKNSAYTLTITQEKNLNTITGMPYTTLRELTGLSYDVPTFTVDGLTAAQVLPRAGSEHINKILFFSKDLKVKLSIQLETPRDGSLIKDGTAFFTQILSTFKFINSKTDAYYFSKRLVDTSSFFTEKVKYPAEMIGLTDPELTGISCTKHYDGDNGGKYFTYSDGSSSQIPMTDPILLKVAKLKPDASALMHCTTEKGQTVVLYENFSGGGGGNNVSHFALWNASGSLREIASIANDGAPYFTCNRPYMLTYNNIFYWGCGGGDGGFGQSSIYAIDLNNSSSRRVIKCTSTADSSADNPVGTATTKCE